MGFSENELMRIVNAMREFNPEIEGNFYGAAISSDNGEPKVILDPPRGNVVVSTAILEDIRSGVPMSSLKERIKGLSMTYKRVEKDA